MLERKMPEVLKLIELNPKASFDVYDGRGELIFHLQGPEFYKFSEEALETAEVNLVDKQPDHRLSFAGGGSGGVARHRDVANEPTTCRECSTLFDLRKFDENGQEVVMCEACIKKQVGWQNFDSFLADTVPVEPF